MRLEFQHKQFLLLAVLLFSILVFSQLTTYGFTSFIQQSININTNNADSDTIVILLEKIQDIEKVKTALNLKNDEIQIKTISDIQNINANSEISNIDTISLLHNNLGIGGIMPLTKKATTNLVIQEQVVDQKPIEIKIEPKVESVRKLATKYDDLTSFKPVTEDQMNYIIDNFAKLRGNKDTPFKDNGHLFIEASKESGLNPIYLFAHAALETGYGTSSMAKKKFNYFGIAAFDSSPSSAYDMGDSMEDGIVNGAVWIKENFYDNGQISLYDMNFKYEDHYYASSGHKWIDDIIWIMNKYPVD